jgi:uncharacterized protein YjbI with pentapeptide repeats
MSHADFSGFALRSDKIPVVKVADTNPGAPAAAAAQSACSPDPTVDLSNVDLRDAHFDSADLRGALLKGATLKGAFLNGAHLACANFCGADLRGVDLSKADIGDDPKKFPDFRGADLAGAKLPFKFEEEVRLSGANLYKIQIESGPQPKALWKKLHAEKIRLINSQSNPEGAGTPNSCEDQSAGGSTKQN